MSFPSKEGIDASASNFPPLEDSEKQASGPLVSEAEDYKRPISNGRWALVCLGLYTGALLYGLDTTIAADVQGPILKSLGEIEKLGWVGIGFPMGSVAVILLLGQCYTLFEIKKLLIASILLFEIGSAVCGSAPSMNAMIIGRVIAGIGGAGMYLGALTYTSIFTSLKERAVYNALVGICWGTGCILGPVIGGGFAISSATWRWAFYINLPLAAACAPIYLFLFPQYQPKPDVAWRTKLANVDWVGAALNAATFTLLQVALTFSGSTWSWSSSGPIALWTCFGVCVIAWALQATFSIFTTPEYRLYPVQFLKSRTMVFLYFGTACSATGLSVGVYYIPIFFQFTKGDDAIQSAVRLLPFICIFIFFVMVSGALLPIFGRYQPFYILSGILLIVGGALMHTVTDTTKTSTIYGFEVVIAVGAGLTMQVGYSVAAAVVKPHEIASAIGFINVAQIGSVAIALSIADCIYQNIGFAKLSAALAGRGFSTAELRAALGGASSSILQGGQSEAKLLAVGAISDTISKLYIMVIAAGALSLVSGIFMRRERLRLDVVAGG
ncbi:MAG: hypothetical protein M1818_006640 [Claussenomyces sp. TS43310]|nr:MAG: hypothetical protein M1818_006927 [Claussenomyces sp. TS43310]KAI9735063.1 MAG: hypothetical protein M1818_006640 [Claussenomyces sp. TS43310]